MDEQKANMLRCQNGRGPQTSVGDWTDASLELLRKQGQDVEGAIAGVKGSVRARWEALRIKLESTLKAENDI
jgi:hypothetical protein